MAFNRDVELTLRDKFTGKEVTFQSGEVWLIIEEINDPAYEVFSPEDVRLLPLKRKITVEADFLAAFHNMQNGGEVAERRQIDSLCGAPGYREGWTCEKVLGHAGGHGVRTDDRLDWYDWPREA